MDHVIQRKKGGASNPDNYLPACWRCNRLRWHRKGKDLRRLIQLGLVANDEIKKATELGRVLRAKLAERKTTTNARRAKAARRTR
jgi:5-methylcytosine-specific restriction endonuclease McrA